MIEQGHEPVHLAEVVGAVLRYDDTGSEEAVELQEMIRDRGERATLSQCAGVDEDHPLVELVLERMGED